MILNKCLEIFSQVNLVSDKQTIDLESLCQENKKRVEDYAKVLANNIEKEVIEWKSKTIRDIRVIKCNDIIIFHWIDPTINEGYRYVAIDISSLIENKLDYLIDYVVVQQSKRYKWSQEMIDDANRQVYDIFKEKK